MVPRESSPRGRRLITSGPGSWASSIPPGLLTIKSQEGAPADVIAKDTLLYAARRPQQTNPGSDFLILVLIDTAEAYFCLILNSYPASESLDCDAVAHSRNLCLRPPPPCRFKGLMPPAE